MAVINSNKYKMFPKKGNIIISGLAVNHIYIIMINTEYSFIQRL